MLAICKYFQIDLTAMLSSSRKRHICDAKKVYAYLMRKHSTDTFEKIGNDLGVHYTSVYDMIERMDDYIFTKDRSATVMRLVEEEFFKPKQL